MAETFSKPGTSDVTPADRAKLKSLIRHYMSKPHPFTACFRDQIKHGLSKDHAARRCAVLKDLIRGTTKWRKGGRKKHLSVAELREIVELSDASGMDCEPLRELRRMLDMAERSYVRDPIGRFADVPGVTATGSGLATTDAEGRGIMEKVSIKSPYNKDFIGGVKRIGGRWNKDAKAWSVPVENVDALEVLVRRVYAGDKDTSHKNRPAQASGRNASPKQVAFAEVLIRRGGWRDSNAGQGFHEPTRAELMAMSSRDISALIDDMKG